MNLIQLHDTCRKITLNQYTAQVAIGAYIEEKSIKQTIRATISIWVPFAASTSSDDELLDVLDYNCIRDTLIDVFSTGHIHLIETATDKTVALLLAYPSIMAVNAYIEKVAVYKDCESIGIEVFQIKETP